MIVKSYPKEYKKFRVKTEHFSHTTGAADINLGFINLIGVNILSRFIAGMYGLLRWAKKKNSHKIIIIYSLHTPFLLAATIAKVFFSDIKLCLIIPDLPEFMSDSQNALYRILKAIDRHIIAFCLNKISLFVVVSDLIADKLNIQNKPWKRVEGIFDSTRYEFGEVHKSNFTIMYSGNLDIKQGILDLLQSFSLIQNENYRLWITGYGTGLHEIKKACLNDPRITYWSKLRQNDLFKLLQQATLLINPLKPDHDKTSYFFPSKIMEYMASGTPTLMYKLPCIPEEYRNHLYFIEDKTSLGMKNKIEEICSKSVEELSDFGKAAQDFIINRKNPETQCKDLFLLLQKEFI